MQTQTHMHVHWKELKAGGRTKPERCFHLEPTVRLVPHVMVNDEGRVRDWFTIGVSIRTCCLADPVVRAGWWKATLERLPLELKKYPRVDAAWLIDHLAACVAFPNVEDRLVAHVMKRIPFGRQELDRRAKAYHFLLNVVQGQAALALQGPHGSPTYWGLVSYLEAKTQALLRPLPNASEFVWQAALGLDPGFTLEDLKRKYRQLAVWRHHNAEGEAMSEPTSMPPDGLSRGG